MREEKKGKQYLTGCNKEFTVTFFDLYRTKYWLSAALMSNYYVLAICPHCHQPNHIHYHPDDHNKFLRDDDDLGHVDRRFVDKLPFKFTRFFSKY